jgi:16S rRNA (guanine1207-N2)-methyltransferase
MTQLPTSILYGHPPRELVDIPADTTQVSPLIPNSILLEALAEGSLTSAVIYAPTGTIPRHYFFARTLTALATHAPLTALARNDKGGSRIAAELRAFGCEVAETSRAHHRIVRTTRPANLNQAAIDRALAEGKLQQHPTHGLWTQPGVFSWDRIDAGSALLLQHLPEFSGHGADFGCGIGVLSRAVLASPQVNALTLVDSDCRAIAAAEKNIADARATFMWADIRSTALPAAALDFVVMNPPFHDTGIEDQSLGQLFITRAADALKMGGNLWLTANRHLPYEALLAKRFARVRRVDEANGFKILHAEK